MPSCARANEGAIEHIHTTYILAVPRRCWNGVALASVLPPPPPIIVLGGNQQARPFATDGCPGQRPSDSTSPEGHGKRTALLRLPRCHPPGAAVDSGSSCERSRVWPSTAAGTCRRTVSHSTHTLSLSLTHSLTLTHTHTLSLTHSITHPLSLPPSAVGRRSPLSPSVEFDGAHPVSRPPSTASSHSISGSTPCTSTCAALYVRARGAGRARADRTLIWQLQKGMRMGGLAVAADMCLSWGG